MFRRAAPNLAPSSPSGATPGSAHRSAGANARKRSRHCSVTDLRTARARKHDFANRTLLVRKTCECDEDERFATRHSEHKSGHCISNKEDCDGGDLRKQMGIACLQNFKHYCHFSDLSLMF